MFPMRMQIIRVPKSLIKKGEQTMRRMDKVFTEKGIIFEADDYQIMKGAEYDCCQRVVDITPDFIIAVYYSAVIDPMFSIYDRHTFELIAQQDVIPDYYFFGDKCKNPWGVATA